MINKIRIFVLVFVLSIVTILPASNSQADEFIECWVDPRPESEITDKVKINVQVKTDDIAEVKVTVYDTQGDPDTFDITTDSSGFKDIEYRVDDRQGTWKVEVFWIDERGSTLGKDTCFFEREAAGLVAIPGKIWNTLKGIGKTLKDLGSSLFLGSIIALSAKLIYGPKGKSSQLTSKRNFWGGLLGIDIIAYLFYISFFI